jgi:hypothetical protein
MKQIVIDRRGFLKAGLAFSSFNIFLISSISAPAGLLTWLNASAGTGRELANPAKSGVLTDEQSQTIVRFAFHMADTWGMREYIISSDIDIIEYLRLKTVEFPSYLSEYTSGLEAISISTEALGKEKQAFDLLAFGDLSGANYPDARISKFRNFISNEFARYLLVNGGFLRFSPIKNYRGYAGGPFTRQGEYLPYRGLEDA